MAVPDPLKPVPALLEEIAPAAGAPAPFGETDFLDPLLGGPEPAERHGRDVTLLEEGEEKEATAETADTEAPGEPESPLPPPPDVALLPASTFETPPEAEYFAEGILRGEPGPFTPVNLFAPFTVSAPPPPPPGVTLTGGAGDDTLEGSPRDDFLYGLGGEDTLSGLGGEDWLEGGDGNDQLHGGAGDDRLIGGAGDDFLEGGEGADWLEGGSGDDTYRLDDTADAIVELPAADGGGFDTVEASAALLGAIGTGTSPPAIAFSGAETAGLAGDGDHLFLITSFVEALELLGTAAANAVGNANANTITGNEGANAIWGGGGDDFLYGADGGDLLAGGGGDDFLAGGEGDDVYVFYGGESGFDVVSDALGTNSARLEGFTATTEAIGGVDGSGDLTVFAHDPAASFVLFQPLFRIEGYSASPDSFAGVEIGGLFVTTDDLLA